MATSSKQSKGVASIGVGRPRATQSSQCEASRTTPLAEAADDARRSADGSIDVEFYKARARAIRGASITGLAGALKRTVCAALARAYAAILAKRARE
jgi:hypothetical protein